MNTNKKSPQKLQLLEGRVENETHTNMVVNNINTVNDSPFTCAASSSFSSLTRKQQVLLMLQEREATTNDFRRVGVCAPASPIASLRAQGYDITTHMVTVEENPNPMAIYLLNSKIH